MISRIRWEERRARGRGGQVEGERVSRPGWMLGRANWEQGPVERWGAPRCGWHWCTSNVLRVVGLIGAGKRDESCLSNCEGKVLQGEAGRKHQCTSEAVMVGRHSNL